MVVDIEFVAECSAGILAAIGVGLEYLRRKYGKWGDKVLAGMKSTLDGIKILSTLYPDDKVLADFYSDLKAAYEDANGAWASNEWLGWANLIKATNHFYAVYEDIPDVINDLVERIKAVIAKPTTNVATVANASTATTTAATVTSAA